MAPWFFATPIGRDPNSTFSVVMSLVPPVNTFAMMIRLASTTPPPFWQVALSLVIGVASAVAAMWFAAKIFKIGLLMHGKPPSMGTLIRVGKDGLSVAIWVGTSGYNYPEWKGSFYPETMPAAKMLPYYAERFPTVEINYTFYRTPNEKILDGWNKATPDRYKLTLKAPKRITHDARLRDCADPRATVPRDGIDAGAEARGAAVPARAELQEGSSALRRVSRRLPAPRVRGVRVPAHLVAGRGGLRPPARPQPGAVPRRQREALDADRDHGRLRLLPAAGRGLQEADIAKWADVIREKTSGCQEVFVYFKHEEAARDRSSPRS